MNGKSAMYMDDDMDVFDYMTESDDVNDFSRYIFDDYSLDLITDLLLPSGLIVDKAVRFIGSFEKFVFLHGRSDEVYTQAEMKFIADIGDVFIYRDFSKNKNGGRINCRVLVARVDCLDIVSAGMAFVKIANKAIDGMNICLTVGEEGLLFSCREYTENGENACFVSNIIKTQLQYEELISELIFAPDGDFVKYYSYIKYVFEYDNKSLSRRRSRYSNYGWIDQDYYGNYSQTIDYSDRVSECKEFLFSINFTTVNTLEMLYQAEIMERNSDETDTDPEAFAEKSTGNFKSVDVDDKAKEFLNDPEKMIKFLMQKRGL